MGRPVKVFQGKAVQFFRHLIAQGIDHLLRHSGHDPALEHTEQQAQAIKRQKHAEDHEQSMVVHTAAPDPFHDLIGGKTQDRR